MCWPLRGGRGTQYTQKPRKYIGKKKKDSARLAGYFISYQKTPCVKKPSIILIQFVEFKDRCHLRYTWRALLENKIAIFYYLLLLSKESSGGHN
jgi:hypothetical protein